MIAALLLLCPQAQLNPELIVAHPGLFEGRYSDVREDQLSALEANPDSDLGSVAIRSIRMLQRYCAEGIDPARLEKLAEATTLGRNQLEVKNLLEAEIHRIRFSDSPYPPAQDLHTSFFDDWFLLGPYGPLNEPAPLWGESNTDAPHQKLKAEYKSGTDDRLTWKPISRLRNSAGLIPERDIYPSSGGTSYLLASVSAPVEEALLQVASARPLQVFWNGELVLEELRVGLTQSNARMNIPVRLNAGANRLMLRFENGSFDYLGARLLSADGHLLSENATTSKSLEATLAPCPTTDSSSLARVKPVDYESQPFGGSIKMLLDLSNDRADSALAVSEPESADELHAWLRMRHIAVREATHLPAEVYRRYQLEVEDRLESLGLSVPEISVTRARRLMEEDQVEDALALAEQLVADHPRVPAFHWIRNDALGVLDRSEVASWMKMRETLEVIDDAATWNSLASRALERSDAPAAIEHLTRAAALDGGSAGFAGRLLGLLSEGTHANLDQAQELIERWRADEPYSDWFDDFELGMLSQRRNLAAIEVALKKRVSDRPELPNNWQLLAGFQLRYGEADEARTALERTVELATDDMWARRSLERLGTSDDAERFFAEFGPDREAALAAATTASGASTALVLDSRLLFVREDGSTHSRTHEITLALDRTGTEQLQEQPVRGEMRVAQVLGADGVIFEPVLVDESWVMPSLDPGDAVEMVFDQYSSSTRGGAPRLDMWRFESFDQPFLMSRYVVYLPKGLDGSWATDSFTGEHREIPWLDGSVHIFEMRDRPRLEPETAAPSEREIFSWVEYGKDANIDFSSQAIASGLAWQQDVADDVEVELRKLVESVASQNSRQELPKALYDAVSEHVIEFGGSGDTTDVWYLRRGNPAGLLAALFEIAEVRFEWAVPFPVGPPELDRDPKAPFVSGNSIGAPWFRIEREDGEVEWLFIPSGGRGYPFGRTPASLGGSRMMVLGEEGWRFETLAPAAPDEWMADLQVDVFLQADKAARVSVRYIVADVSGPLTREAVSQLETQQREQAVRQIASRIVPGVDVTTWNIEAMRERGEDFVFTFEGTLKRFVRGSKSKPYFRLIWPRHGLSRAVGEGERRWPFVLRNHRNDRSIVRVHGSDSWELGLPPESKEITREGFAYSISFDHEANVLTASKELRVHGLELEAAELAEFAQKIKDLEDLDTAQLPLSRPE